MTSIYLELTDNNTKNVLGSDLYGNPEYSFFSYVLRRNTNFFSGNINIYDKTHNITNLNNINDPIVLKEVISGDIDLLSDLYISFYLPDIYSSSKYKFKWVENIGALLIKNATFTINSQDIDSFTGEWLCVWNELSTTNKDTFNAMSGNSIDINNPKSSENIIRIKNNIISDFDYPSSDKNNPNNKPSIPGKWVSAKLPFWFTKAPNLALPIFGNVWSTNTFYINISFESIEKLYTVYSDVYNMNVSPSYYNLLHNEKISIENFINIGNNIRVKIIATCIVLDTYEKKRIADICSASNDLIYLYETVRVKTQIFEPRSTGSRKIEVDYGFLIKEMIWTLRRSDSITNFNNILNYSYNIPFNNEKSILEKAKISWGTKEVMTETGSFYFNQIQPYQYHNSIPKQGIYLYSFSLLPEKSIHSGSYNSANSIKMIIDMNFNKYEPSVLDSMYEKKYNKSYILNNPVNIETVLYITEYKFLQITQNNINLRYSN
jgi:hypothetical protein